MKVILAIGLAIAVVFVARAETPPFSFRTLDGTEYKGVTVTKVTPEVIQITHADGAATLPLRNLPQELQQKFGFDPARAAEFAKMQSQLKAAEQRARQLQATAALKRQIASNLRTVLEVESDLPRFVGTTFYLSGSLALGSHYNFAYDDAQDTHFSFRFYDQSGSTAYLFMRKNKDGETVRTKLLDFGGSAQALCAVRIERHESRSGTLYGELLGVSAPLETPDYEKGVVGVFR